MSPQFIEDQKQEYKSVPYYDDVSQQEGWKGQTTSKTLDALRSEVTASIGRLGGLVVAFKRGKFLDPDGRERAGMQLYLAVEGTDGRTVGARIDIAALPVRKSTRGYQTYEKRVESSMRMALFMLRDAMDGQWFLQQMMPGYAPLIPWMLAADGKHTLTELWAESGSITSLLPPPDSTFEENGDVRHEDVIDLGEEN
jgi:hypothetical protein